MINVARAAFNFGILIQSKCRMRKQILALSNMGEKFNLTWHTFTSHGQDLFKNLFESQEFSDVTLISDDHHQYKVHKFILSACSTVFRKILTSNHLNSTIYLRGIHHEELESILQYIYLGKATFCHGRMNEFLNVAKNLGLKEIGENVLEDNVGVENSGEQDSAELTECKNNVWNTILYDKLDNASDQHPSLDLKTFKCIQCNYKAKQKSLLKRHVKTQHEGIKYPCQLCDHQATTTDSLQQHIKSIHQGVNYQCQLCDYKVNSPSNLRKHVQSKHEGVNYQCQICVYKASDQSNLKKHVLAQHEGIKYCCKQCDYQTNYRHLLKNHITSKHESE